MDPITHGLTGALIAKAFFAPGTRVVAGSRERPANGPGPADSRAAVWTTTLAALFPDSDIILGPISRSSVGTLEFHRWVTHSIVCLPVFALAMAALARWWILRRGRAGRPTAATSYLQLAGFAATGIASHILLDLITSWGTMAWSPLSRQRVAWDLVFIIDFVFAALVLLPQLLAWIFAVPHGPSVRARRAWAATSLVAVGAGLVAQLGSIPLSWTAVGISVAILGICFYAPAYRGWGIRVRRESWCRAGMAAAAAYILACGVAHNVAVRRVESFIESSGLAVESLAAVPLPPSLTRWAGLVQTAGGVHQSVFSVLDAAPPQFRFVPHQTPPAVLARARQVREVQVYLWFARFPVARYSREGQRETIVFNDLRFPRPLASRPAPFEYRIVFDSAGQVVEQGWVVE